MIKIIKVLTMLATLVGTAISQDTFFSYDFEFGEVGGEGFSLLDIVELNLEGGLVGEWSGDDFQLPDPTGFFAAENASAGIVENPHGGTMMFIDRPIAPAQHMMNLTEPILTVGATFSATVGTRRTGGGAEEPKSYDFFGLDSDGNESFRIRILADGSRARLGYVAEGQRFDDFDTVLGEDMVGDIAGTGGQFGVDDDIVELKVTLGGSGYVVSYNNLNGSNAWTSAIVPFNGNEAQDLAQVVLSYGGVPDVNPEQVGFIVDDVSVTGFTELLQGDFDGDADIDMNDFLALAGNLGNTTSEGDFDFNGVVDLSDWLAFKAAYNAFNPPAGSQAVPEPTGVAMLYVSMLALFVGRRRSKIAL